MQRPTHAGLRHLALNVQRFDEMKRFYIDLLGFAVEWEPDADNVYLSSGIDNLALHRASLATPPPAASLPETPPPATSSASPRAASQPAALAPAALAPAALAPTALAPTASPLDHLGLIAREAEDVDRWAAFLEGRGVAIDARPRTHRDGARSCYFRDPDGNSVQIIHHPPISGR
jgi:catechol 2,3-dioxygenase-like lactoylglutathione lyase family enzyme